jgi:prophage regulatory protein
MPDDKEVLLPKKEDRLLRKVQVLGRTGLSTTGLYTRVASRSFPRPVSLGGGGRAVAWVESEVQDWIEARKAERETAIAS